MKTAFFSTLVATCFAVGNATASSNSKDRPDQVEISPNQTETADSDGEVELVSVADLNLERSADVFQIPESATVGLGALALLAILRRRR